jgi:hypothetical protein
LDADRVQALQPPRFDDDGLPVGMWRRRVLLHRGYVATSTLPGLDIAASALADARHVAWITVAHALWLAPLKDIAQR